MKTLRHRLNQRFAFCGPLFLVLFLCGCSQRTTSPDAGEEKYGVPPLDEKDIAAIEAEWQGKRHRRRSRP
jgi:hypothetical protein